MKTSNKLLLGLLVVVLLSITALIGAARYYSEERPEMGWEESAAPPAPEAPEAPNVPE